MRAVLAQLNLLVGDVRGNAERTLSTIVHARDELGADLVVFPELTLTGYPPEDLLYHAGLRVQVSEEVGRIAAGAAGIDAVIGYPEYEGDDIYNVAALLRDGTVHTVYRKQLLPNYAVFDEKRYFTSAHAPVVVDIAGVRVGLTVCEDMWFPGPAAQAKAAGAELLLNISASPFQVGRQSHREQEVFGRRVKETGLPLLMVTLVGGQDELVFDGGSLVLAVDGSVRARAPAFKEALLAVDFDGAHPRPADIAPLLERNESIWQALCLGTRDYVEKNGFPGVVLGLSGGIDSALATVIAADALGADRVQTVMMPSRHTAQISIEDAEEIARRLGVEHDVIPIDPAHHALLDALSARFAGTESGIAEQNLQARCRGTLLMALSNKFGRLVLITGNKSELAVGYATLYGDMAGGFAPLKDLTKTNIYALAEWRNTRTDPPIPQRVIERPPSAELAPGQFDQDTLPSYGLLDVIIEDFIEKGRSTRELLESGHDPAAVHKVVDMIKASEYKRRQAAPGVRVTAKAFGRDRRYPITSGYSDTPSKD